MPKPSEELIDEILEGPGCYSRAIELLRAEPAEILHRRKEMDKVYAFLTRSAQNTLGIMLNVNGVPGVGKRTAVRLCIQRLHQYEDLTFVEVAGSKSSSLSRMCNLILNKLVATGNNCNEEIQLDRLFSSNQLQHNKIVLLIANIDLLVPTTLQLLLKKLSKWIEAAPRNLSVVLTSTSLALMTALKNSGDSRILVEKVVFPAYQPS